MAVVILGLGWVNALGTGMGGELVKTGDLSFSMGAANAFPRVTSKAVFGETRRHFGRLDDYSRNGIAGIAMALGDAGMGAWEKNREIGMVVSTRHGCLATDHDYFGTVMPENGALSSPNLFAYTLPSSFIGEASIHFGLTGPGFVVGEDAPGEMRGLSAAWDYIADGELDLVLWGICDLGVPEFMGGEEPGKDSSGVLFFLLGKSEGAKERYGFLSDDGNGGLLHDGHPCKSPGELARRCLTAASASASADE